MSALPEARLELATYHLLLEKGYDPGPWIGEAVRESSSGPVPSVTELNELLDAPARDRSGITDEGPTFGRPIGPVRGA